MEDKTSLTPINKKPIFITTVILLISLIGTIIAGYITKGAVASRQERLFYRQADQIANTYYSKLYTQITILEGLKGLWNSNGGFTQSSFSKYLESFDLNAIDRTGVSSYFFTPAVKEEDLISFSKQVMSEKNLPSAYKSFTIHPESNQSTRYPAIYAVPMEGREGSIGLDFSTFPERLDAITYARDTNALATTKAVTLQSTGMPGFFFIMPLYKPDLPIDRAPERKLAFAGAIGAIFRSESAFEQIFGGDDPYPHINFHIYQGDATTEDRLLYDSDSDFDHASPRFTTMRIVRLRNQTWTIVVESKPSFTLIDREEKLPFIVFTLGFLMTFVLGVYAFIQISRLPRTR